MNLAEASSASLCLLEADTLVLEAVVGLPAELRSSCRLRVGEGVTGWVAAEAKSLLVPDVRADPRYVAVSDTVRSELAVPLVRQGTVIGVINVESDLPDAFGDHQVALLEMLSRRCVDAIAYARLYEEAKLQSEELRQSDKLAALGRLSAGLAHEIRNPLNTMSVLLYAMIQKADRRPPSLEDLRVIDSELGRLSLLVDQFLDFAKPKDPTFARHDVGEILAETFLLVGPQASKSGVRIHWEAPPKSPAVWADGNQLKQVFLNLALNAIQVMPDGGDLRVTLRPGNGNVVVEITDTGPGISEEARERIFEPFYSTREGGHGLGLAISHRIVESHSGQLRLDSAPEGGAIARVWLPA